ncbi:MAG: hypothetical protein GY788_05290 [bacterium]|nr:hypothetical protein [bacterium]
MVARLGEVRAAGGFERQAFGLDEPDVAEKSPWEQLREELNAAGFRPVEDRSASN